jgi:hypothetical protein
MELKVKRNPSFNGATIGKLFVNEAYECFSLEDEVRPLGQKVYGKTAIPAGRYEVIVNMSNRFKKMMPLLLKVPGFEGVRIHPGNKAVDTDGCILLGLTAGKDSIFDSVKAYVAFMMKINKAITNKEKVFITIS